MIRAYDPAAMEISQLELKGTRIDRVHGKEFRVRPRFYAVKDRNLRTAGEWILELYPKLVPERNGASHESIVVSAFLAPMRASNRMALLTRQSIMFQPATRGRYKGRPYAHITFREPGVLGGKKTAGRGEKTLLPDWFRRAYRTRIRLRQTVQGKVISDNQVGQQLSKYHDIKQVIIFDEWDDIEFIRLFFMMRVYAAEQDFEFRG